MNRTSIRQSDINEYIKSTKLIPSSNPLKLPSPDKLTGKEQIASTENPISLSMNHFKERNIGKLEELQRLLIEKEEIISRLKGELASKKPITSDKLNRMDDSEKTQMLVKQNEEMRKDIKFLRELLDSNSKLSPNNQKLLEELEVYKNRCEELTLVLEQWKREPEKDHKEVVKRALLNQAEEFKSKMTSVVEIQSKNEEALIIKIKELEATLFPLRTENERLNQVVKQLDLKNRNLSEEKERILLKMRELEDKTFKSAFDQESLRKFDVLLSDNQAKIAFLTQENERLKDSKGKFENINRENEIYKEKLVLLATENEKLQALIRSQGGYNKENEENLKRIKYLEAELSKKMGFESEEIMNFKNVISNLQLENEGLRRNFKGSEENVMNLVVEIKKMNELLLKEREFSNNLKKTLEEYRQKNESEHKEHDKKSGAKLENEAEKTIKTLALEIEQLTLSLRKSDEKLRVQADESRNLQRIISEYEEKLAQLSTEIERNRTVIRELESHTSQQSPYEIENVKLKENFKRLALEVEELNVALRKSNEKLREEARNSQRIIQEYEEKIAQMVTELERTRNVVRDLEAQRNQQNPFEIENSKLKEAIKRFTIEIEQLSIVIKTQENKYKELDIKYKESRMQSDSSNSKEIGRLRQTLYENEEKIAMLASEIERLRLNSLEMTKELENYKDGDKIKKSIKALESQSLEQELNHYKQLIVEYEEKIALLTQELERTRQRSLESSSFTSENQLLKENIKRMVIEIEELNVTLRRNEDKLRAQTEEYRRLKENLESGTQNELFRLKSTLSEYEDKIAMLTQELERTHSKFDEMDSSEKVKKSLQALQHQSLEQDIVHLTQNNKELQEKIVLLSQELEKTRHRSLENSSFTNENQGLRENIKQMVIEIEELNVILRRNEEKTRGLEMQLHEKEIKYQMQSEEFRRLQDNQNHYDSVNDSELSHLKLIIKEKDEKLALLSQEIERWRLKTTEYSQELDNHRNKIEELESGEKVKKSIKQLENHALEQEINNLKHINDEYQEKISLLTQELQRTRQISLESNSFSTENSILKENIKRLSIEIEELNLILKKNEDKLRAQGEEYYKLKEGMRDNEGYEREILHLKQIISENNEKIVLLSQELERWRVKSMEINQNLEVSTGRLQDLESAEKIKRAHASQEIQSKEQEFKEKIGFLEGENIRLKENLKKTIGEIEELNNALRRAEELSKGSSQIEVLRREYDEKVVQLTQEIERIKFRTKEMERENISLHEEVDSLQKLKYQTSQLQDLNNENNSLKEKLRKIVNEIEELTNVLRMKDAKLQNFEQENENLKRNTKELASELMHTTEKLREMEVKFRSLTEENLRIKENLTHADSPIKSEVYKLKSLISEYEEKLALISSENEKMRLESESLKRNAKELANELMHTTEKLREIELKFRSLTEENLRIKENLQHTDSPIKSDVYKLKSVISEYEEKLAQISSENERLRLRIKESESQFASLHEEIDSLQRYKLQSSHLQDLANDNNNLREKMKRLVIEIEELSITLRNKDSKIQELEFKFKGNADEIERNLQNEIIRLKSILSESEEKNSRLLRDLENNRQRLEETQSQEKAKRSQIHSEIQNFEQENEGLKRNTKELATELMHTTEKLREIELKFRSLTEENLRIKENLQHTDSPIKSDVYKLKSVISEYEEKLAQISSENERLRLRIKEFESQFASLHEEIDSLQKFKLQSSQLQDLANDNNNLREKVKRLVIEIEELSITLRNKDSKIQELEFKFKGNADEIERNLQNEIIRLKSILSESEEKNSRLLRDLENNRQRLEETQSQEKAKRSQIHSEIQNFEQENEGLKRNTKELATELMHTTEKLREIELKFRSLTEENLRIKENLQHTDSPIKSDVYKLKSVISEYEEKLAQISSENERLRLRIKESENQFVSLHEEIDSLQRYKLQSSQLQDLGNDNNNLREKVKRLVIEIEELSITLRNKDSKIQELEFKFKGNADEIERNLQNEIIRLKSMLLESEEKNSRLLRDLENNRQRLEETQSQEKAKRSQIHSEIQNFEQENEGLKRNAKELANELMHTTEKLKEMEVRFRSLNEENLRIKENLQHSDSPIKSEVYKLKSVISEYEEKLAQISSENERLRLRIKESENQFVSLHEEIDSLQKLKLQSSQLQDLLSENNSLKEKLRRLVVEIEELSASLRLKESKIEDLEFKFRGNAAEIERTSQNEIIRLKSVISESEERNLRMSKDFENYRQEREKQEKAKKSLHSEIQNFEQENENLKRNTKELATELMHTSEKLREIELKFRLVTEENQRIKENLQQAGSPIKSEVNKLNSVISEYEEKLAQISTENERLRLRIKESESQRISLQSSELQNLSNENNNLKEKLRKLIVEIEELSTSLRLKDSKIQELEFRFKGNADEIERNSQWEISRLKTSIADYEQKIVLLTQEMEKWRIASQDRNKELENYRIRLEEIDSQEKLKKMRVSSEIHNYEQENESLRRKLKELVEELSHTSNKLRDTEQNTRFITDENFRLKDAIKVLESKLLLGSQKPDFSNEISNLKEKIRLLVVEIEQLNQVIRAKDNRIQEIETSRKEHSKQAHVSSDLQALEQENLSLKRKASDLESELKQINLKLQELEQKYRLQSEELMQKKLNNQELEYSQKDHFLMKTQTIEYESKISSISHELDLHKSKINELESVKRLLEANIQEKEANLIKLNSLIIENKGIQSSMQGSQDTIKKLLIELEESQKALRVAEGLKAQNQALSYELESLRNERKEHMTRMSNISVNETESQNKISTLIAEKEVLSRELDHSKENLKRLASNHMEEINQYKRILEEFQSKMSNLSDKSRIEELQSQNQQLMISLDSANVKNRSLLKTIEEMSQNLLEKDRRIESMNIEFSSKSTNYELISEKQRIKDLMNDLEYSRKKALELEEKLLTKDSKLTELSLLAIEIERLNSSVSSKDQTIARIIQELQASNQLVLELQAKQSKSGVSRDDELRMLRSDNERLKSDILAKERELQKTQANHIEEFNRLKSGFSGNQEGLSGRLSEISIELQELKKTKDSISFEKAQMQEKILRYEEKVTVLAGEIERLTKIIREKDEKFDSFQLERIEEISKLKRTQAEMEFKVHGSGVSEDKVKALLRENEMVRSLLLEKEQAYENSQRLAKELEISLNNLRSQTQVLTLGKGQNESLIGRREEEIEKIRYEVKIKEQRIAEIEGKYSTLQRSYQDNIGKMITEINELHAELKRSKEVPAVIQERHIIDYSLEAENANLKSEINSLRSLDYEGKFKLFISENERLSSLLRERTQEIENYKVQSIELSSSKKLEALVRELQEIQIAYKELLHQKEASELQLKNFINSSSANKEEKLVLLTGEIERLNELITIKVQENDSWRRKTEELIGKISQKDSILEAERASNDEKLNILGQEIIRLTGILNETFKEKDILTSQIQEKTKKTGNIAANEEKIGLLVQDLEGFNSVLKEKTEEFEGFKANVSEKFDIQIKENKQLSEENQVLKASLKDMTLKLSILASEIERLGQILNEKQAEIDNLQGDLMNIKGMESQEIKNLLISGQKDYEQLKEKYQKSVLDSKETWAISQKYEILENKLKSANVEIERINSLNREREKLYNDEHNLLNKLKLLEKDHEISQEEAIRLKELLKTKSQESDQYKNIIMDLQTEIAQKKAIISVLEETAPEATKNQIIQQEKTNIHFEGDILVSEENKKLKLMLDEKFQEIEALKTKIEKIDFQTFKIPNLEGKITVLLTELEKLNGLLNDKMQENMKLSEEISQLKYFQEQPFEKLRQEYETQISHLKIQITQISEGKPIIEETKEIQEYEQQINDHKITYAKLEGEFQAMKETYKTTIISLTERVEQLNKLLQTKGSEYETLSVKAEMNEKEILRLREWQEKAFTEIETLKLDSSQFSLTSKLSQEKLKDYQNKITALLKEVERLTEVCNGLQEHIAMAHRDIIQRDQALKVNQSEITRLKEVIKECRQEIESRTSIMLDYEISKASYLSFEMKCKGYEEKLNILLKENESLVDGLRQRQDTLDGLALEKAENLLRIHELEEKVTVLETNLQGSENSGIAIQTNNEKYEQNIRVLLAENEKLAQGLERSTTELRKKALATMNLSGLQNSGLQLSTHIERSDKEKVEILKEQLKKASEDIKSLRTLLKELTLQNEAYKIEIATLKILNSEMPILHENVKVSHENFTQYQQRIELLTAENQNLKRNLEEFEHDNIKEIKEIQEIATGESQQLVENKIKAIYDEKLRLFEGKVNTLIKNTELLTKENSEMKEKLSNYSLEILTKDSYSVVQSQLSVEKLYKLEEKLIQREKEISELLEKNLKIERSLKEMEPIQIRLVEYETKVLGFGHEIERLTALIRESNEEILRYREVLLEKEVEITQKSLIEMEVSGLKEAKISLLAENEQFRKKLQENLRDIEDLAQDRKSLMLKIEILLDQISKLQEKVTETEDRIPVEVTEKLLKENENLRNDVSVKENEINRLMGVISTKNEQIENVEEFKKELQDKVDVSIQIEIRNLKEKHSQERVLWEKEIKRLQVSSQNEVWKEKAQEYERVLLEQMGENEKLKALYERQKQEIADLQGKIDSLSELLVRNSERLKEQFQQLIQGFIEGENLRLKNKGIVQEGENEEIRGNLKKFQENYEKVEENMRIQIKELIEKNKKEKEQLKTKNRQLEENLADMNRFYSEEMQNLKGKFESSIIQRVENGLKDVFNKMQSDKMAYERIILEKDHQIVILKEIIKKIEDSKSKDLLFLREEAFKIKENQLELVESEKNTEKLSFLGKVEQLKGQIRVLEANLETKNEENSKIKAWNLEKNKEVEVLKEKIKVLEKEFEDYKVHFEEKDVSEAIIHASKEKSLLELQIRNLRNTIDNQKIQIDKLYEKLDIKRGEGELG